MLPCVFKIFEIQFRKFPISSDERTKRTPRPLDDQGAFSTRHPWCCNKSVTCSMVVHSHASPTVPSIWSNGSTCKLIFIKSVVPSHHLILCHPHVLLPSIFPSIRVFSNESLLPIRWPKYWSFSFNFTPSNECSGLISFRMDWLDLLAVQGTLKSLLQHHSSKHQFFSAQPSSQSNSHIHTWPMENP